MSPTRINFFSIAKVAEVSEQTAAFVMKQVLAAIALAVKKDQNIKLNLRVGSLKVSAGSSQLSFIPW
jgi:hypothetical protein